MAVTVGLDEIPAAENVIVQECAPKDATATLAALIDAVRVAGVLPDVGLSVSHAQSLPKDELKLRPLEGLVLVREIPCDGGMAPSLV